MKNYNTNDVALTGVIVSGPTFDYSAREDNFYTAVIATTRLSDAVDEIRVVIPERLLDLNQEYNGKCVHITGKFYSYYNGNNPKYKLKLSVRVRSFELADEDSVSGETNNHIMLDGYICKPPVYRKTPFNKDITDILVAVNRPSKKSDYIPCICWRHNAEFASKFKVGDHVVLNGRIQSRGYVKKLSDGTFEDRTAYEVSVHKIDLIYN